MPIWFDRQAPKDIWVPNASGVRLPARRIWVDRNFAYQDEVVVTLSGNYAQINAQNYFTAADWQNPLLNKRLVLASGNIWSYTAGVPALNLGTGRSGPLYVDIKAGAYVLGAAGVANGGAGGTAILVDQNLCYINNAGYIYGGGGAGGKGGQGGPGYYQTPYTYTEGPTYGTGTYGYWYTGGSRPLQAIWGSTLVYNSTSFSNPIGTTFSTGGWNYTIGSLHHQNQESGDSGVSYFYYLSRSQTRYQNNYTSGGAGGNGGKGAGYNSSLTNGSNAGGSAGAAGGTNAGSGGYGGTGGGWGAAGNAGATGNSGNNGAGSAGTAGGAAGCYIEGYGNLNSFVNTGTVLGRAA